jgi:Cys-rich protein (TIGR01571 family)
MTVKDPDQVRVVAPSNLNAGYTFDVTTEDGRTLNVRVPVGGVVKGEPFDAEVVIDDATTPFPPAMNPEYATAAVETAEPVGLPTITKTVVNNPNGTQTVTEETRYPDGRITTTTTTTAAATAATAASTLAAGGGATSPNATTTTTAPFTVPTGAWRTQLFSCFDTCSSGIFWMTWCLQPIAIGQLLTRMKLNFCGSQTSGNEYKQSCIIWTTLAIAVWVISWFVMVVTGAGYLFLLVYAMSILAVVALTQTRYYMRQKYAIQADCCEDSGCLSDCCCMWWCSCCGIIQMMRHTHDERKYVYHCSTSTGLYSDAPEIV